MPETAFSIHNVPLSGDDTQGLKSNQSSPQFQPSFDLIPADFSPYRNQGGELRPDLVDIISVTDSDGNYLMTETDGPLEKTLYCTSDFPTDDSTDNTVDDLAESSVHQSLDVSLVELTGTSTICLPNQISCLGDRLIQAYFSTVCPIFSTFDSPRNPFRSFVHERWQSSPALYYTMLSMSAGKLGRVNQAFKVLGLNYQLKALQHLQKGLATASTWTSETLFVILMLGLSSAWHNTSDLGLVHLKAMRKAVYNHSIRSTEQEREMWDFFQESLVYWEMITSFLDDPDTTSEMVPIVKQGSYTIQHPGPKNSLNSTSRVNPHPWASIAGPPQAAFTRLMRLIRQVRSYDCWTSFDSKGFLVRVTGLEEELWTMKIPSLHEIANTGDENSLAIHHLMLREAYMFANFYQLYQTFPKLWRRKFRDLAQRCMRSASGETSWMETQLLSDVALLQQFAALEDWLNFLGRNVIIRLEQIPLTSGTSCVQPLLLLIGSTSLSLLPDADFEAEADEVLRLRNVVLDRLSYFSAALYSEPTHNVRAVVVEIFRRLDSGMDVFWTEPLMSMGMTTIIG